MENAIPDYMQYHEEVTMYLTEEDKESRSGLHVTIGMRRKNIAIASDRHHYYLLNKDNVVIYKIEKQYDDHWNDTSYYCIKRSLTGYYIVIGEGNCRISRPGRDDDYVHDEWISAILDENGIRIDTTVSKEKWKEFACGKYPMEMGCGLVCYDNVFYDLESLKIRFFVSNNFVVKGIFNNGLSELEFVTDSKDYIIKIQEGKVVKKYNIDNFDDVIDILLETNDYHIPNTIYPITYSDHDKDELTYKRREQLQYKKDEKIRIGFGNFGEYAKITQYDFYTTTISDRFISKERFIEGIDLINSEELQVINELYQLLQTNAIGKVNIHNTFLFAKRDQYSTCSGYGIDCQLFSGFFVLICCNGVKTQHVDKSLYRFYDYKGRELSSAFYHRITYPIKDFQSDYYDFNSHVFIFHGRQNNKNANGIINIIKGQLEEFLFSNYTFLQNPSLQSKHVYKNVYNDCIEYAGHYYSFKGDELPVKYIEVDLINVITGIIKKISPDFYFRKNRFDKFDYEPIVSNGVILLPNAVGFESCIEKRRNYNKERHPNIKSIIHIGEYTSNEGDFSLYKVEYHPIARCDINGVITLESNPAILKSIGLFDNETDDLQTSK